MARTCKSKFIEKNKLVRSNVKVENISLVSILRIELNLGILIIRNLNKIGVWKFLYFPQMKLIDYLGII